MTHIGCRYTYIPIGTLHSFEMNNTICSECGSPQPDQSVVAKYYGHILIWGLTAHVNIPDIPIVCVSCGHVYHTLYDPCGELLDN